MKVKDMQSSVELGMLVSPWKMMLGVILAFEQYKRFQEIKIAFFMMLHSGTSSKFVLQIPSNFEKSKFTPKRFWNTFKVSVRKTGKLKREVVPSTSVGTLISISRGKTWT